MSLMQSLFGYFGSGLIAAGTGFALHDRGVAFSLKEGSSNALAPRKRPFHTIIPGFMQKGEVKIGFGIMQRLNQALRFPRLPPYFQDESRLCPGTIELSLA